MALDDPLGAAGPGGLTAARWRLAPAAWGRGYATEAAALALAQAHEVQRWRQVVSYTAATNLRSLAVMRRLGMTRFAEFEHPTFAAGHPLRRHVLCLHDASTPP